VREREGLSKEKRELGREERSEGEMRGVRKREGFVRRRVSQGEGRGVREGERG
jgi:hypothetical protein